MTDRKLTHLSDKGEAHMVDVSPKPETLREAIASARVRMKPATRAMIFKGQAAKGDVLATARIAGIQATKRCADLIPLCHPLRVTRVEVDITPAAQDPGLLDVRVTVRAFDRTGVEMEAMTAASVAALTIYDMVKAVDRWMVVESVQLEEKRGGKSGDLVRDDDGAR